MTHVAYLFTLLALFSTSYCIVTIPDSVSHTSKSFTYYVNDAVWYLAHRVCRAEGSYLVLVDGQRIIQELNQLTIALEISSLSDIYTRMIRHDNREYYSQDDNCSRINSSSLIWASKQESYWDPGSQCIIAEDKVFKLRKTKCEDDEKYVCEKSLGPCEFQKTSVSLASVPLSNANMTLCQAQCRQMIGCFATAPSGSATLPPFTHCLFIVTGDSSNLMTTINCLNTYLKDENTQAKEIFSPNVNTGPNPPDCVPSDDWYSAAGVADERERPLSEFIKTSNVSVDCNQTVVSTPVTETVYVTLTPQVHTAVVTEVQTQHVTLMPDVETVYITVTPVLQAQTATKGTHFDTTSGDEPAARATLAPSIITYKTVTTTLELTASTCTPAELTPASTATRLPPQNQIVTQTQTQTYTTTVTTTSTLPLLVSTRCPSQLIVPPCSAVTDGENNGNNVNEQNMTTKPVEALPHYINSLMEDLRMDPRNLSKTRRRKESAPDARVSAQTIGITAGLLLLAVSLTIILLDLPSLYRDIWQLRQALVQQP